MKNAIVIKDVKKSYGDVAALKGVDLEIKRGEFFGLLGPNGAGKSTLINIIAGLTRSDYGQVSVMGHDVVTHYRQARQSLGVVPQELVFDSFFSVREVLKIQAGYFGCGREVDAWIDELLHALGLEDKANSNMRALSGGMKRRVLIAQALVHKPDVVMLDEPTAGVDVEARKLLWEFITRLHGDGHTIVLTTHYLEEAEELCNRIAILNHGKIVALDSKAALLESDICNTMHVVITVRHLINDVPAQIKDKLVDLSGNVITLEVNRKTDSIVDLLDIVRSHGLDIIDLHTKRADLEDVFVELTQQEAS